MQFSYSVSGNPEGPWLTLSHPIGSSKQIWETLAARLGQRYRVLTYDLRGHGQSPMPAGQGGMDDLAGDCEALWDQLGVEKSAFVGLSLGGCIGVALADRAPHRLTALVVACSRLAMDEKAATMWRERAAVVRSQGMSAIVDATLDRWLSEPWRAAHPELVHVIRITLAATDPEGFAQCAEALAEGQPPARMARLAMPVQFLAGLDDKAVPSELVHGYAQQTPGARYAEMPGPHLLHLESEQAFHDELTRFLEAAMA